MKKTFLLSVGIPVLNEELLISRIVKEIETVFQSSEIDNYEIIFVDNNSTDSTYREIEKVCKSHNKIKAYKHSVNYGYQTSIHTCMKKAKGDYLVILDGDMQDPPNLIPKMLDFLLSNKLNIVFGVRRSRDGKRFQNFLYKSFYKFWIKIADIPLQKDAGEFAIYDRKSIDLFLQFKEKIRFHRGLRAYLGLKQAEFLYDRESRKAGVSKFNFIQQIRFSLDAIFSFSLAPIRMMLVSGLLIFGFSMLFSIISVIFKIINIFIQRPILPEMTEGLVIVFFLITTLLGIIVILLGIIGEYLGRLYEEVRERPVFIENEIE